MLHSAALRRLAAKTQVVEVGESDFPRTRLTHSLECAQVGRELGKALGCDPDLVEAACLAHDLGHPPFGHNGEAALDEVCRSRVRGLEGLEGFEGNAQSFRILTRLEAKVFAPDRRSAGLNLTRAALDAAMKYPWFRGGRNDPTCPGDAPADAPADAQPTGQAAAEPDAAGPGITGPDTAGPDAKYGVYADDAEAFAWVREGIPRNRPCFEAQVMDWADDVAYSVHDLEDGLHAGHVDLRRLHDPAERRAVCDLTAAVYCDAPAAELADVFDRLLAAPYWPRSYDGTLRSLAALKELTSTLIGRFCRAAERETSAAYGGGRLARYRADLVVPRTVRLECALLKGVTASYVMSRDGVSAVRSRQREMIFELVDRLLATAPDSLDRAFRACYERADGAGRLRVVVDQVASLTDTSAIAWHRRLTTM